MGHVDSSQVTPLYANTTPGLTADANVFDPAIAALIVAINENFDLFEALKAALELPVADQSVTTRILRNGAVTNAKLAPLAVTADKIADGTISTAKLADMVITAQKIANNAILERHMSNASVSRRTIVPGAVGANEIDPSLFAPIADATVQAKFNQIDIQFSDLVANVRNFGATGGVNDSLAFQAANDYLVSHGGGVLFVPAGTWYANFIIDSKISLRGQGVNITTIKSVAGSNKDVIKGRNFDSLTGTPKQTPETRGVRYTSISDITIDGNKANNTSGYGIRIWGCSWSWRNVIVMNCANDNIWTEFTTHEDPTGMTDPSSQALESDFNFIKSLGSNGNGWTYNGPHDSILNNYTAFSNIGWALRQNSGALSGSVWNSWLNGTGSYYVGDSICVHRLIASAAYVGTGIEFKAGIGNCMLTAVAVGAHPTGIIVRGSSHIIDGYIREAKNSDNTAGDAIVLDGAINCKISVVISDCFNAFYKISELNTNFIEGHVNLSPTQTMISGPGGGFATADYVNLFSVTGQTHKNFLQFPDQSFHVGGWNPKMPLSNGVIITDETVPSADRRGGVLRQPNIPFISASPTKDDYNNLIATLITAGVLSAP